MRQLVRHHHSGATQLHLLVEEDRRLGRLVRHLLLDAAGLATLREVPIEKVDERTLFGRVREARGLRLRLYSLWGGGGDFRGSFPLVELRRPPVPQGREGLAPLPAEI